MLDDGHQSLKQTEKLADTQQGYLDTLVTQFLFKSEIQKTAHTLV